MSNVIDERVVQMEFDNDEFEKNVQSTVKSLDKLQDSLELEGASKGLEQVDAAAQSVDLSSLASNVESLANRFSTLGIVGMTAISNITSSVMSLMSKLGSFITSGIVSGGITRAMNIEDARFMLQGLLDTEEEVEAVMDSAKAAVQDTAYGFDAAAKVASQLVASGMEGGEELTSVLRAVAGTAAMTNSEYSDIGDIFTTVAGNGKLMTEQLRQFSSRGLNAAATLAEYLGTSESAVREMVTNGEIDFETFAAAMDSAFGEHAKEANTTFTGSLSNIKAALARIGAQFVSPLIEQNGVLVGLFNAIIDKVKVVEDEVGDFADRCVNAASTIIKAVTSIIENADLTNTVKIFYNLVDVVANIGKAIWSVVKPIGQAFMDVFPDNFGEGLVSFTDMLVKITEKMILTEEQSEKLRQTFDGIFSIIGIGITFIKDLVTGLVSVVANVKKTDSGILDLTASFGNLLTRVAEAVDKFGIFKAIANGISTVFEKLVNAIKSIDFSGVSNFFSSIGGSFGKIGDAIRSFDGSDFFKILDAGVIAALAYNLKGLVYAFRNMFGSVGNRVAGIGGIVTTFDTTLQQLRDALFSFTNDLKADAILKLAEAIAILAVSMLILASIDSDKLSATLGVVTVLIMELAAAMKQMTSSIKLTDVTKFKEGLGQITQGLNSILQANAMSTMGTTLIKMAAALLILAIALKKISDLDMDQIAKGLVGIGGLMAELVVACKLMSTIDGKAMKGALKLVIFAEAINILASVCKDLSSLSWEEMAKGLTAVGSLIMEVVAFMALTQGMKVSIGTATGLLIFAAAMKVLASVCSDFASLSWEGIAKGLSSVMALILELSAFSALTSSASGMIKSGLGVIAIAAAMKIFAGAMADFETLSWEGIGKGLTATGGGLLIFAAALNAIPNTAAVKALGLVVAASSIAILGKVLSSLSDLSWTEVAKGLTAIGGSMTILAIGLNAMKGTAGGSAALLIAAVALAMLVPELKALGKMSWEAIAKGLIAIAGAFTVLGIGSAVLSPLIPVIIALAAAVALLGAGCALAGVGVASLAVGIAELAAAMAARGAARSVKSAGIVAMASGIMEALKVIAVGIGDIIVGICESIANSASAIGEAITALILALCNTIQDTLPTIIDTVLSLIVQILASLCDYIPQIVDLLADLIIKIMDGLATKMPDIVSSAANLIQSFVGALSEVMFNGDYSEMADTFKSIGLVFVEVAAAAKILSSVSIGGAIQAVADFAILVSGLTAVLIALGGISAIPGVNWLISKGSDVFAQLGTAIGTFIGNIVGGIADAWASSLPSVGENLSEFMNNLEDFIDGAKGIDRSVVTGVVCLSEAMIALTAGDFVNRLLKFVTGGFSLAPFGKEIAEFGTYLKDFSDKVSGMNLTAVQVAVRAGTALVNFANDIPNSGGLKSFFAGDNDIADFGEKIVTFGEALVDFSDAVSGVNPDNVKLGAAAGAALATMTQMVPDTSGIAAFFGVDSLSTFSNGIVDLGDALSAFSDSADGIDEENVKVGVRAGQALAEMTSTIPDMNGVAALFGLDGLSTFSDGIIDLGRAIKNFSRHVSGVDEASVTVGVQAAKDLADMTNTIPNYSGIAAFFGADSLSTFNDGISKLGKALKNFSKSASGIDEAAVGVGVQAGKDLADMTKTIPDYSGIAAFFGADGLSTFSVDITKLGWAIKSFSNSMSGVDEGLVETGVTAGENLAEMTKTIPDYGGIAAFFGADSLSTFSTGIAQLGWAIKMFSNNLSGVDTSAVELGITAGTDLATMTKTIPDYGGIAAFFGADGLSAFSGGIAKLGWAIKSFGANVSGVALEDVEVGTDAGSLIATMTESIPNYGGIAAFFGADSLSTFSGRIGMLGWAIKRFATNVSGVNKDDVAVGTEAGALIATMTETIPNFGGIAAFFGADSLSTFSANISALGGAIKSFSDSCVDVDTSAVEKGTEAGELIATMTESVPDSEGVKAFFGLDSMSTFSSGMTNLGGAIADFSASVSEGINIDAIDSAITVLNNIVAINVSSFNADEAMSFRDGVYYLADALGKIANTDVGNVDSFITAVTDVGSMSIDTSGLTSSANAVSSAVDSLNDSINNKLAGGHSDVIVSTETMMAGVPEGIENTVNDAVKAIKDLISDMLTAISDKESDVKSAGSTLGSKGADGVKSYSNYSSMKSAGQYLGDGLVSGIQDKWDDAYRAGYKLGQKAVEGEKAGQESNSPSKATIKAGKWLGQGLVIGIEQMGDAVYSASSEMGSTATNSISSAIARISDAISSDIDAEPTIRPVIDLSDATDSANALASMFDLTPSIGVMSDIGTISASMQKIQNGSNSDVVSAIEKLGKKLGNSTGNTYNVNGVTYDDGSSISSAVQAIVRAARVERRT